MDGWMDEQMDGWMDGWMQEWMNAWPNQWTVKINPITNNHAKIKNVPNFKFNIDPFDWFIKSQYQQSLKFCQICDPQRKKIIAFD